MKTRYPGVTVNPDRHGKLRARFRKAGRKPVYMKTLPDQPGFKAEYQALLEAAPQIESRAIPGSVSDLLERYYRAADFAGKGSDNTKARRRWLLESFRREYGDDQVSDFTFEHIEQILLARTEKKKDERGRTFGGQVAAVKLRKEIRRLFAYARKLKWISENPVDEADKVGKTKLKGFHTWTEEEIAQYQAKHAIGTRARLALEIILWTGQRRGDARLFGPKHIVNGKVNYTTGKTGADLWLPVARDLRRAIAAMNSVGITAYLVTGTGQPFSKDGFGNKMREWCDEAGLPHCSAHGLRKAIARRMAETKLSDEQMKAVGGWKDTQMLRVYTEAAEQEGLADGAIRAIDDRYSTEKEH